MPVIIRCKFSISQEAETLNTLLKTLSTLLLLGFNLNADLEVKCLGLVVENKNKFLSDSAFASDRNCHRLSLTSDETSRLYFSTDPRLSASPHSGVDVEGLRRAWESEKLALLDAIQSLKELLTQTATEAAVSKYYMLGESDSVSCFLINELRFKFRPTID